VATRTARAIGAVIRSSKRIGISLGVGRSIRRTDGAIADPVRAGGGGTQGAVLAAAGPAVHRIPQERLAYRVVTWPLSGMWTNPRARNSSESTVSVPAVGPDLDTRGIAAIKVDHALAIAIRTIANRHPSVASNW